MIKKEKLGHSETIYNWFLISKMVYKMIFDQFGTFFDFRTLFHQGSRWSRKRNRIILKPFINGTDHQEWRPKSSRINLKPVSIDFSCQNWFIGWFSTNLEYFRFSDSFLSREPMIKKEKLDQSETISNWFLVSKLVYGMIFDHFGTFSIFGLLFTKKLMIKNWW